MQKIISPLGSISRRSLNKDEKIRLRGALLDIGPLPRIEIICENILPLTGPFDGKIKKNIICSGFLI